MSAIESSPVAPFTYAGATLMTQERGRGDRPIVLIHGIGMGMGVFADLISQLGEAAWTIALDLPGYGSAPEPERVLTMERTADLIAAFLRDRGTGPAVLVGHSMGTQVAVEVAARHPHLVDTLVLVGPTVDRRERSGRQQLLRLLQDVAIESPKVIVRGAREYLRAGPRLGLKMHAMIVHRPEDVYPLVSAPTLVLRGEDDRVASRDWCAFVTASIPGARAAEVPGHGHEAMIRDAAPAAREIERFLRGE
ncbi:alpha/beta hydrolase [Microbacterium pumilum]